MIQKIEDEWETLDLNIVPSKLHSDKNEDTFILVDQDTITSIIEDHLTTLEVLSQSSNATHVKEKIVEWQDTLQTVQANLEKWCHTQKTWIYMEPIFAKKQIQRSLPKEYE